MTDKELRKLSREDLLDMLVEQSREVERLKKERSILITQLRFFKAEFEKVGSLDAILNRLGYPASEFNSPAQISALDELLLQYENEESAFEIFERAEEGTSENKKSGQNRSSRKSGRQDRLKEALDWTKMQFGGKK